MSNSMANPRWDGKVERRLYPNDHDNIVRAITILENHVKNFDSHVVEDKENFKTIRDQIGKHAIYIYMSVGGLAVLNFLFRK